MTKFLKTLSLGAVVLASASIASATPIASGSAIVVGGTDSFTSTSIQFTPAIGLVTGATSNLSTFVYSPATLQSFNFAAADGVTVFSSTNYLAQTVTFTINNILSVIPGSTSTGPTIAVAGTGTLNETGFDPTNATFNLTSSTDLITGFSIESSSTAVTPEPNSLMLLGTGLVSAAGMLVRRRRVA